VVFSTSQYDVDPPLNPMSVSSNNPPSITELKNVEDEELIYDSPGSHHAKVFSSILVLEITLTNLWNSINVEDMAFKAVICNVFSM
jgi:hypothetical protein